MASQSGRARGRLAMALVIGVLAGGCEAADERGMGDEPEALEPLPTVELPPPMTEAEATDPSVLLTADLRAAADGETVGSVRVVATRAVEEAAGAGFSLHARVEGLSPGAHAWHIHSGACGSSSPVAVPFTTTGSRPGLPGAEPLLPGEEGVAQQSLTVPAAELTFEQLRAGDYSLRVHERGGADHGPTVACADL